MFIKNFIKYILGRDILSNIRNTQNELLYAQIFHDSINDKPWLKDLSLNPGRWAIGYPYLYVLNRVLSDFKPKNILEFGLGESSKLISTYLDNYLPLSTHDIIEHDISWGGGGSPRFELSKRSIITYLPIIENHVKGKLTKGYDGIDSFLSKKYDLYCIDGPFGSDNFSRYDIVNISLKFTKTDEFIILFDDYNRHGEVETVNDLLNLFKKKNIIIHTSIYSGDKMMIVIATEKYKYATTF